MPVALRIAVVALLVIQLAARISVPKDDNVCENIKMVSREQWKARPAVRETHMPSPASHVIILHTAFHFCHSPATCTRNVQFTQDFHLDDRGWWDIAYSFIIGGDGRVYVGRGWNHTGAFAINYNTNSIGIGFLGNFMTEMPTDSMIDAALGLIECGIIKGYLTPSVEVHGHRDVACTMSPGDNLYRIIRQWKYYKGGRMKDYACYPLPERTTTTP